MPQSRHPSSVPEDRCISSRLIRVIVKTPGNEEDFSVSDNISVRQFKEKLCTHFKCQKDQIVLVFMGRLLQDQDTLRQRGITDGHTIHLVIRSKCGSRSLAHSSRNLSTNEHQDRDIKGNSSGVCQPAGESPAGVESTLLGDSDASGATPGLEIDSLEHIAQMLENPSIQRLLSYMEFMQQLVSEQPDMKPLIEQNPELAYLLDNSEILGQTLELVRHLAVIQEIMQFQQPSQNLEHPPNPQPLVGLETIRHGNNAVGHSYADTNDQILHSRQGKGVNVFIALLAGQVLEQFQSSPLPPPSPQERCTQLLTPGVIYDERSCGFSALASNDATPSRANHPTRESLAPTNNKGQSHVCMAQQPAEMPTLPSTEVTQEAWAPDQDGTISLCSSEQGLEEEAKLSEEQAHSQATGGRTRLLTNQPHVEARMMLFMNVPQLSEEPRQQVPTSCQPAQPADLLLALADLKASQVIVQIEHGLQLLAREAPILLPWVEPCLSNLGWLAGPSCSYPDTRTVQDMAEPEQAERCQKSGAVPQRLQPPSQDPSHPLPASAAPDSQQTERLQATGFVNHHVSLKALIDTGGDTELAICKLERFQGD